MGAENLSCVKSIETHARAFLPLNISAISSVLLVAHCYRFREPISYFKGCRVGSVFVVVAFESLFIFS